ncbi:MAG: hypothetical protein QM706_11995 [Nitrospira sp.]
MFFSSAKRANHIALCGDDRLDAKLGQPHLHFARFHFGQIENVVDHVEQQPPRLLNVVGVALLLVVQRVERLQHFRKTNDAIERRSQLVAHVGQKFALQPVHLMKLHIQVSQLIDLVVKLGVGVAQLPLRLDEMHEHLVERDGQVFKFIVGMNVGPLFEIAASYRIAHLAQMVEWLDDDVLHDVIQSDHCQEHRQYAHREQNRAGSCSDCRASPYRASRLAPHETAGCGDRKRSPRWQQPFLLLGHTSAHGNTDSSPTMSPLGSSHKAVDRDSEWPEKQGELWRRPSLQ